MKIGIVASLLVLYNIRYFVFSATILPSAISPTYWLAFSEEGTLLLLKERWEMS